MSEQWDGLVSVKCTIDFIKHAKKVILCNSINVLHTLGNIL